MSGGSFNYLFVQDVDGLAQQRETIQRMADVLRNSGYESIAKDTEEILQLFEQAEQKATKLKDVWHAVEWWVSNDWSEQDAKEAAEKYLKEQTK